MWTECQYLHLPDLTDMAAFGDVSAARRLLDSILLEFPDGVDQLAQAMRLRTSGRFMDEWRAAGAAVGLDWKRVALANVSYDLAILALGCSTLAAETAVGPVLARNLDWWPERDLAQASVGIWVDHWFSAGWPGFSGIVTGMSKRGFAVALNAIELPGKSLPTGYPVLLMLRRVVEDARTFDEAVELLSRTRLLASCLLTVVGTSNDQRVVIERSPSRAAMRWGEQGSPLLVTNDFRALDLESSGQGSIYDSACSRFDALEILAESQADFSDQGFLDVLTDSEVFQSITVQQTVMRPSDGVARTWVPTGLLD